MNFGKNVKDKESKNIKVSFFKAKYRIHFSNDYIKDKYRKWFWRLCGFMETSPVFTTVHNTILKRVRDMQCP